MRTSLLFLIIALGSYAAYSQSQEHIASDENDTLPDIIHFTPVSASEYIYSLLQQDSLWRDPGDTMYLSLSRVLDHYHEPVDSVAKRMLRYDYESVRPEITELVRKDTIPLRWLNDSVFIVKAQALEKDPFITKKTILTSRVDTLSFRGLDSIPDVKMFIDSISLTRDTITEVFIDSLYLQARNITMYRVTGEEIEPPFLSPDSPKELEFMPDSSHIVISERYLAYVAAEESPFYVVPGLKMPDSLRLAVAELLHHTHKRDSVPLYIRGSGGNQQTFWLSSEPGDLMRYWVHNHDNDSITIWLGNPSKYEIRLLLEDDIHVKRMGKLEVDDYPIVNHEPERSLIALQPLEEIQGTWNYGLSSAFSLNQNYVSNWAKGGESALSSLFDLKGSAEYHNRRSKAKWINNARLRYGNIISEEYGFRTNNDIFEINSQYNKSITEKFDFSSVFYGKTQISKGYDYPNDSIPISGFLSPGAFTIGAGFEYEPFPNTKLNFSALSYRNTFVLDTTNINQRAHGIEHGKRSRQEMGGQLVITNKLSLIDDLAVENSIRLFSNYLEKPQNLDVDWELNMQKQVSWFFTISVNFHLIYNENILFPVLDGQGEPVTYPDGSPKEEPRIQIKQFLGVTMSFSI
jgi:hypothetical protein